jgi:hypothetical protein
LFCNSLQNKIPFWALYGCIIQVINFTLQVIGTLFVLPVQRDSITAKYLTIMKKKNVNLLMVMQWVVFLPLLLPISMLTGAMEGIKKVFEQANEDIFEEKIIESM